MAITKEFSDAVESKNLLRVHIMLKDILLVDPTAMKFEEMEFLAHSKLSNLYDVHNGETLNYDMSAWNKDYLNEQMVAVVNNFSKERVELLKSMVRHIYSDKAQKTYYEESSSANGEKHVITQKHVGTGVSAAGAALTVIGVCTSHTILAIGGLAAAAVGVALIVTDKG